jgi:hypothetical protein
MKLLANLDCEARWAGVPLPDAVRQRISLYAALFAACAPDDNDAVTDTEAVADRHEPTAVADRHEPTAVADRREQHAVADRREPHAVADCPQPHVDRREPHAVAGSREPRAVADRREPHAVADRREPTADSAPAAPHEVWVPAAVDASRLLSHPGWTPPQLRTGQPPAADLMWADPAARAANDRAAALAIAQSLGVALPGACVIASLAELDAHLAGSSRPWICKARWTAAGRDRARGIGAPTGELRNRLARMLDRFGPLVFEPWLDRVDDLGICGTIGAGGDVAVLPPHRSLTDARGGFLGIELGPIDPALADPLAAVARAAAAQLHARTGYRGPFAIDAFVHRDGGAPRLHPLCEINARYSFGWIARGLARRLGIRRLGFDAPPPRATVLIAPADDRVTAWCA